MRHFKVLGSLWLLFGLFWTFAAAWALIAPSDQSDLYALTSTSAWGTDLIGVFLECAFFVASAVFGLGLLRRWRRAHIATGVLGGILLAVALYSIPCPWFPPTTVGMKLVWTSPLLS